MDDMRVALVFKKLQLIYLPFLLLSLLFVSGYSLLHWLLVIKLQLLSIDESLINFWLPLILPWPLLFFYLRPRLKLFRFAKSHSRFIYLLVAVLLLAVPTMVAQEYLNRATGQLTQLYTINELQQPLTKYYQLKQFYIDKKHIGVQHIIEPSGRGDTDLHMAVYIAMPIFASRSESWRVGAKALAWYGKLYQQTISNKLDKNEKESIYQEFITNAQQEFNGFKPDDFVYLDRIGPSTRYTQLLTAAQKSTVYHDAYQTILMPVNTPFEARNGNKLAWIIGWFCFGAILWLVMSLMLTLDGSKLAPKNLAAQLSTAEPKAELYAFLAEFKPRSGFVITPILLFSNALIFMLMVFASNHFIALPNSVLIDWGANLRQLVLDQQVWRLITNLFLHGGLMHLIFNLYGLFFAGMFLEPLLGKWRLLGLYLMSGFVASIASISWYEATISIGASGAIMGLFGVLIMWIWMGLMPLATHMLLAINLTIFLSASLVMGLFGGVDNAAHLGGLGCGLLLGSLLRPTRKAAIQHK